MNRRFISRNELATLMTEELRARTGRSDCSIEPSFLLRHPDDDGCNWSGASLKCAGASDPFLEADANATIDWARDRYNLDDPDTAP